MGRMEAILRHTRHARRGHEAQDETRLAERFRDGDQAAFEEIVTRHRRTVYSVARRMLRSHEDADEAAQQAFVRAWRSRESFRGDAALRTWLTRIVLNVARTMRGSRWSRQVDADEEGRLEALPDLAEGAEATVRRGQLRRRVRRAVSTLPPRQREVLLLKVFSEMTYREVAEVLGLSEGAVKAHLHQAVGNLRRHLQGKEKRR